MIRCLFIACLCSGLSVFGSDPPAELLQYNKEVIFDGRKVVTTYFHEIQINHPSGSSYGEIQIPFSDIYRLSKVEAVIMDVTGRVIRKVKKKEMTDRSAIASFSFYENDFRREFTLKHNNYPYRIRYAYTISNKQYITIANWIPVMDHNIPTRSSTLRVTVPATAKISYYSRSVNPPEIEEDGNTRSYSWTAGYEGDAESEIFSPPDMMLFPSVTVMPDNFQFDQPGSLGSWKEFGNWVCDLNEGQDQLTPAEEVRIESLISGAADKRERLELLYKRLQEETRYVNITIETGGYKPYPASYVAEKKYGDCKALTNYFQAVLRKAGIDAYYSLVYLGENIEPVDTTSVFPQFNHAILMVPLEEDTLWVDCTSKAPLGYTGPPLQSRKVLIVERDNSKFLHIPGMEGEDVVQARKATFSMTMNNKVKGDFQNTFRGSKYQELLYYQKNLQRSTVDYVLRNYFTAHGFDPVEHAINSSHPDSTFLTLDVEAVSSTFYKKYGNDLVVDVLPLPVPRFEKPGRRVNDVQIDCPIVLIDTFEYRVPEGYEFSSAPQPANFASVYGKYSAASRVDGDQVVVEKQFILNPGRIPLSEYEAFYDFINNCISSEINHYIIFTNP